MARLLYRGAAGALKAMGLIAILNGAWDTTIDSRAVTDLYILGTFLWAFASVFEGTANEEED